MEVLEAARAAPRGDADGGSQNAAQFGGLQRSDTANLGQKQSLDDTIDGIEFPRAGAQVVSPFYQASSIKRRRATKAEMVDRLNALFGIVESQHPMTVRQCFYQATVQGLIDKTEQGCAKVNAALTAMRRSGRIPYDWITDSTRLMRKPRSFRGIEHAVEFTARTYRKALWEDTKAYVEIWIEKDALAGVVLDVTSEYDVPLMWARGYSSRSFLYSAAEAMADQDRPCFVYQFGDWDPSGVDASRKIRETLREMAPRADISFERVGVTPAQIAELDLPSRPTKTTDARTKTWTGGDSAELDALPARVSPRPGSTVHHASHRRPHSSGP